MPRVTANGMELEYEEQGEGEPLVLIMGLGAQLIHWPDGFVDMLADAGFRVVRFDNRDIGLSTKLDGAPLPPIKESMARRMLGLPVETPYRLSDMADDVAGLMDALDMDRAHVVGASLGGMVAQTVAIRHPKRVQSLTSIMSHTGGRTAVVPMPRALNSLLASAPRSRLQAEEAGMEFYRTCGSPKLETFPNSAGDTAGRAYERCHYPRGFVRQLGAMLGSGSRARALQKVRVPSLVIHGTHDPLCRPVGGRRTAAAIPGAQLEMIPRMGHDLPTPAWPRMVGHIANIARA
jgi:pimeloyl-ACP methyl ester carboxylesterase